MFVLPAKTQAATTACKALLPDFAAILGRHSEAIQQHLVERAQDMPHMRMDNQKTASRNGFSSGVKALANVRLK